MKEFITVSVSTPTAVMSVVGTALIQIKRSIMTLRRCVSSRMNLVKRSMQLTVIKRSITPSTLDYRRTWNTSPKKLRGSRKRRFVGLTRHTSVLSLPSAKPMKRRSVLMSSSSRRRRPRSVLLGSTSKPKKLKSTFA